MKSVLVMYIRTTNFTEIISGVQKSSNIVNDKRRSHPVAFWSSVIFRILDSISCKPPRTFPRYKTHTFETRKTYLCNSQLAKHNLYAARFCNTQFVRQFQDLAGVQIAKPKQRAIPWEKVLGITFPCGLQKPQSQSVR